MDFIASLFGGGSGNNPANNAMPYFDQAADTVKQYYNPFISQGQGAYGQLEQTMNNGQNAYNAMNPALTQMSTNPTAFLEALMQHYQPSNSYQTKLADMTKAAGNTAAAGGMRGSLNDIKNQANLTNTLMGEDMQQWLQNVLGIQNTGLSGLNNFYNSGYDATKSLYNTGYDASKSLSSDLANILGTQGQLAFQGQRENNQSRNDLMGGLLSGFGGALGGFF